MGENRQTPIVGKATTHRQHYMPRFFIRGFIGKGQLAVLKDGQVRRNVKPENICVQNNLYETPVDPQAHDGVMLDPNGIENALGLYEAEMAREFDAVLKTIVSMCHGDAVEDETISRICNVSSLLVASLIVRSPTYLAKTIKDQMQNVLDVMKRQGYGTAGELNHLLRKVTGEAAEDWPLSPRQVAEHVIKTLTVAPFATTVFESSPMIQMASILRTTCSFLFLTTGEEHPFIGLSMPYITEGEAPPTLVLPLSSRVCVICMSDGRHMFGKKFIGIHALHEMNAFLLGVDNEGLRFCAREDYLRGGAATVDA